MERPRWVNKDNAIMAGVVASATGAVGISFGLFSWSIVDRTYSYDIEKIGDDRLMVSAENKDPFLDGLKKVDEKCEVGEVVLGDGNKATVVVKDPVNCFEQLDLTEK